MAVSFTRGVTRQVVSALRHVFQQGDYSDPFYGDLYIGTQYRLEQGRFPMIVISYRPSYVRNAGLGLSLRLADADTGEEKTFYRWRSEGQVVFNVLALNPYERDTLVDNVIDVIGFGQHADSGAAEGRFLQQLTDGDFVALTPKNEDLQFSDMGAAQTPWGSENDLMFQGAVFMDAVVEFYSDSRVGDLVPISKINSWPYRAADQPVPTGEDGTWGS